MLLAVRRMETKYKAPARYGDTLTITTKVTKLKNVTLEFFQEVKIGERILVEARISMACIDSGFKPTALPDKAIENLKSDL